MRVSTSVPTSELVVDYLTRKRVANCSPKTLEIYQRWLDEIAVLAPSVGDLTGLTMARFLATLQQRPGRKNATVAKSTMHQAFRTIRTFCRFLLASGALRRNPLEHITVRTGRPIPDVPTDDDPGQVPLSRDGARVSEQLLDTGPCARTRAVAPVDRLRLLG